MRRSLLILGGVVLISAIGFALWPRDDRPNLVGVTGGPTAVAPREFKSVDVTAHDQGLALTGTVRDSRGAPVPNAQVFLAASSQPSLVSVPCDVCGRPLLTCQATDTSLLVQSFIDTKRGELVPALTSTSDAQGKFRFEHLAGISFMVWGRAQGFGDGMKERAAPGDPVELFLPPLRSIAGRLKDENGAPVAGVVRAMSRRLARVIEAKAEADGRFELTGLGEGPFYVLASAPGKLPAVLHEVEAGPQPVTMTLLTPRRLEVRLVSAGQPVDGTVRLTAEHLSRELVSKEGLAVFEPMYPGQLTVSAVSKELAAPPKQVWLDGLVTRVTLSLDRGGTVAVTVNDEQDQPVPDPSLELRTTTGELVAKRTAKTGEVVLFGPLGVGDYLVHAKADGYSEGVAPAAVKAGELALEVTLTKGIVISGKVIDEYGRPASGVSILVTPTNDTIFADNDGKFRVLVPSPGLYVLHAHHSDWGGGEVKVQAPKSDVELQLEPKAGAQVTVMSAGRRVEGAHVAMYYPEGNYRSDRPSGADGVVLMRGLPPETYTLVATHPDLLPSDRQIVKLEDGQLLKVTVELQPGAAVSGQVVDQLGAPVPGVSLAVTPRAAEPAVTDESGHFSIKPVRPKVAYVVRVTQRGFDQPERTIAIGGGDPVRIVVKRQPIFKGRVLSDKQPVKHFRVDEHDVTSADGRFELALPSTDNRVIVAIEAPGFEPIMEQRPSTPDLGDFELKRAPLVTGVVHDENGAPVPDAIVTCDSCEQSVTSAADGRFAISKPPFQNEFTVMAKKGRRTASKTLTGDVTTTLELVLKPGVVLSGHAFFSDGKPAAGVEIAGVNVDRAEPISVVTNADGSYSMEVAPGIYRLMLALPPTAALQEPPALISEVTGKQGPVDFGPVPGTASVTARIHPEAGYALWLVRGDARSVSVPPIELLRSSYAQLIYQPHTDRVTFGGLQPGLYTLIWASFHAESTPGPVITTVNVPGPPEVNLVQ